MNHEPRKPVKKTVEIFPGAFAGQAPEVPLDDGYGDPHAPLADDRPDFVKADDEGWQPLPDVLPRRR